MIVVDTSAIMEIVLKEVHAQACMDALVQTDELFISAGTLAELLIVAMRRKFITSVADLILEMDFQVIPVTADSAQRMAQAYQQWGKGVHPAKLNYGDCFAYALAKEKKCPLLYIGNDFLQTDIPAALPLPN